MAKRAPNIVLTIADDQRFDVLSAVNPTGCRTPNLDRLAKRGTCFLRAHCLGSTHGAVCAPSRAMLHTGWTLYHIPDVLKEPWTSKHNPAQIDPERVPLLGECLQQNGYDTFATGKWHNGPRSFARSFGSANTVFFGGMTHNAFEYPVHDFDPTGVYAADHARQAKGHTTELFSAAAIDFLRSRRTDADHPFFLYCAFTAPHDPRTTLSEYHARYRPQDIPLPPNFMPQHPFDNGDLQLRDEKLAAMPRESNEIRRHIADYFAMTEHMDDAIGRIHRAVADAGLADDTIFIHTADHGLALGQHGLMGKQNLYDHSIRVPLILAGPGIPEAHTDARLCYQHDLFPTLLRLTGTEIPKSNEFVDLFDAPARSTLANVYARVHRAVKDDRYKLIEYLPPAERVTQLFDLQNDPWETKNIATERPDLVAKLRTQLGEWQACLDDPILKMQ